MNISCNFSKSIFFFFIPEIGQRTITKTDTMAFLLLLIQIVYSKMRNERRKYLFMCAFIVLWCLSYNTLLKYGCGFTFCLLKLWSRVCVVMISAHLPRWSNSLQFGVTFLILRLNRCPLKPFTFWISITAMITTIIVKIFFNILKRRAIFQPIRLAFTIRILMINAIKKY